MKLSKIRIENFCSCADVEIELNDFTPIIGYNNAGKSNILRAISWLLRKSSLPPSKFTNVAKKVLITGTIENATITNLPLNQQNQIGKYIKNGCLQFRRYQETPNASISNVKIEVFDQGWIPNPTGIDKAIAALFPEPIFIEAMDDVSGDVSKFAAKNTIGLLLKNTLIQINKNNSSSLDALNNAFSTVFSYLTGEKRIKEFSIFEKEATTSLKEFFPGLSVHLNMNPPSLDDIVGKASLSLSEINNGKRDFESYGHGTQRSVQMALINLLATQTRPQSQSNTTTLLLIDEPELYLHPHAIELLRESLKKLTTKGFQIVLTTHNPLIIGSDILNTVIAIKKQGHTTIRKKSVAPDISKNNHHQKEVIFSLQNSSYFLFSETIILVEGKTEKMLIPSIYEIIKCKSLGSNKICLIDVGGTKNIKITMGILYYIGFNKEDVKAIVDLDFIFKVAIEFDEELIKNNHFIKCKQWFTNNASSKNIELGQDGFPRKPAPVKPEEAFKLMAQDTKEDVAALAKYMKEQHNIWVWTGGAIEAHLGITKDDKSRLQFIETAKSNNNVSNAIDESTLKDCVNWITPSQPESPTVPPRVRRPSRWTQVRSMKQLKNSKTKAIPAGEIYTRLDI